MANHDEAISRGLVRKDPAKPHNVFGTMLTIADGTAPDPSQSLTGLLQIDGKGNLYAGQIRVTEIGLIIPQDDNGLYPIVLGLIRALLRMEGAVMWLIGDAVGFLQSKHNITPDRLADLLKRDVGTIYNWSSTCSRVHISRRRETLPFSHHIEVAMLEPDDQSHFLGLAEERRWSVAQLRRAIAGQPEPEKSTPVDRALTYTTRLELQAAKLPRVQRLELADEFERLAGRLRTMDDEPRGKSK